MTDAEATATITDVDVYEWYEPAHKVIAHRRAGESYATALCGKAIEGGDTWFANAGGTEADYIKCLNCRGATNTTIEKEDEPSV